MQPLLKNNEQRDNARLTHVSPISIKDIKTGATYSARMFNFSDTGIYFESDSMIAADTEIYLGIQKTPYEDGGSDYNCYRAIIAWRKDLPEDSHFFYGYGLKFVSGQYPKNDGEGAGDSSPKYNRRHPRRPLSRPIKLSSGNGVHNGITTDISPSGVFVKSNTKFRTGQLITLAITDKNGKDVLVRGKVVWSNKDGFGVKFIKTIQ
jgi:hypothetical protein